MTARRREYEGECPRSQKVRTASRSATGGLDVTTCSSSQAPSRADDDARRPSASRCPSPRRGSDSEAHGAHQRHRRGSGQSLSGGSRGQDRPHLGVPTGRPLGVIKPPAGAGRGQHRCGCYFPDGKTIACAGYTGRKTRERTRATRPTATSTSTRGRTGNCSAASLSRRWAALRTGRAFLVATSRGSFESTTTDFGADASSPPRTTPEAKALIERQRRDHARGLIAERLLFLRVRHLRRRASGTDFHES